MKFTTFWTRSALTLAFIMTLSTTHSMAAEVDCTNNGTFKPKAKEEYDGSADTCIADETAIVTNSKMSLKVLSFFCQKKNVNMGGSNWKTKNVKFFPQETCDKLGGVLDCAAALKSCKTKADDKIEECAEKIKNDKKKGASCRLDGAYDPALEALKAKTGYFASPQA
ncbi:MAG: hypothetical protein V4544_07045 [Pseudomonadota bacterium]